MEPHDLQASPPVSVALVDDDSVFTAHMRELLAGCFAAIGEKYTLAAFPDAEAFWEGYDACVPDIVFFDIQLPGENGIDMARKLYARDKRPVIVFVTANPEFAVRGYGVNALGFIEKPPTAQALRDILAAARKRLSPSARATLPVRCADGVRLLPFASITHVESRNRRVLFHGDGETAACNGKLDDFLPRLPPEFLQVHKSFLVNLDRVRKLRAAEAHMDSGTVVPISRQYRQNAAKVFFARLGDETEG